MSSSIRSSLRGDEVDDDRVLEFCKDLTLIPGPARLGRLTAVADEFRALHELNRAHFGASPEIEVNIDRFKDAVERIAALPMCEVVGQSGVCPACGKSLTITRKRARPLGQVVEPRIEVPAAVVRPGILANPPVLSDSVEQARYCSPCLEILMPSFESLSRHYPVSRGCTSPFAPTWINEMVRRQG